MPDQQSAQTIYLINARVVGYDGLQCIQICDRSIQSIQPMPLSSAPELSRSTLDMNGDWLSLGGIDLQINGALGLAFPDLDAQNASKLVEIGYFLWNQGVDGYLPTLVTTSIDKIQTALAAIAPVVRQPQPDATTAQILGVHLEGPCLNAEKRGAHPAEHLQPLSLDSIQRILGDYADVVKVITLAPELDPTGEVIPYLRSHGITVSLGHSQATAAQAQAAFNQGATMVTHAFNAMPGLHHREPGLLGAAIADPRVQCGLIADGQHVCSTMMDILLRASRYEQGIFLVSDALSPLGLPDGRYPWDEREIEVVQGTARLLNGTLSGTTRPLLDGVKNLVNWRLCDLETAIALATLAPRRAIGLTDSYIGQPAHLLRWQDTTGSRLVTS